MRIFLDTADLDEIREAARWGILSGVTTNPTLVKKSGGKRHEEIIREIATIVDMYDDQPGEAGQLRYLLDRIEVRRADLEQRRRDIDDTLSELDEVAARCREDLAALA